MARQRKAPPKPMPNVYQDRDGNWIGVRLFRFPSGAEGVERIVLIKRSQNAFADRELRAEAEARAAEWEQSCNR